MSSVVVRPWQPPPQQHHLQWNHPVLEDCCLGQPEALPCCWRLPFSTLTERGEFRIEGLLTRHRVREPRLHTHELGVH